MTAHRIRPLLLALAPLVLLPAPPLAASPAAIATFAQGEREKTPPAPEDLPDKRPEIAELLDQLDELVKERGKQDPACEPLLEQLAEEYPKSGPKDRKSILKDVSDLLTVKRKDLSKDVPDERLATFAAVMLGRMGPDAGPILAKHVGHKKLESKIKAHRAVVLALGATKWEDGLETLIKALDEDRPEVRAAAAEAMANFKELDQKKRKEIVEELIKVIVPIEEQLEQMEQGGSQAGANYEQFRRDFDILRAPVRTTLEAMTGASNSNFRDWNAWWNDHKRDDWDEDRA